MAKKYSIRDIAHLAGVSVASVSNVLNGKMDRVSAETAKRIQDLFTKLDYQPNLTARSLSSGKSRLVGLVFPVTIHGEKAISLIGENPFYGEFFDGVENVLRNQNYDIILAGFRPEHDCSDWVRQRSLDGVIFLGSFSFSMLEGLERRGVPVVLTDSEPSYRSQFCSVGVDDEAGAFMATNHLISLGHRRIALAGGDTSSSFINASRENGYRRALESHGIGFDPDRIFRDTVSMGGGRRIAERMLASADRPSAVFAMADTLAIGIISVCLDRGLQIPRDLSVTGFDDLAIFRYLSPGLTTIRQDVTGKGSAAAERLLQRLNGDTPQPRYHPMPLSLVIRSSTAAPNTAISPHL